MNRSETLDHVKEIITKDRQATHGEAENSFAAIASFWGLYLNQTITPEQVAEMMVLFKMARQMGNPHHADNLQDLIGYAAIAAEMRQPSQPETHKIRADTMQVNNLPYVEHPPNPPTEPGQHTVHKGVEFLSWRNHKTGFLYWHKA